MLMTSNYQQPKLTHELHMRVSADFLESLNEVATRHNLKPSTLSRLILMRYLSEFKLPISRSTSRSVSTVTES